MKGLSDADISDEFTAAAAVCGVFSKLLPNEKFNPNDMSSTAAFPTRQSVVVTSSAVLVV